MAILVRPGFPPRLPTPWAPWARLPAPWADGQQVCLAHSPETGNSKIRGGAASGKASASTCDQGWHWLAEEVGPGAPTCLPQAAWGLGFWHTPLSHLRPPMASVTQVSHAAVWWVSWCPSRLCKTEIWSRLMPASSSASPRLLKIQFQLCLSSHPAQIF